MIFDASCSRCSRLVDYLSDVRQRYPHYHCAPVAAIGPEEAPLLVVGLAPGLHGANASGIPFTGDTSGELLFRTLFETGFSRQPVAQPEAVDKGLIHCRITNAVKCLPPQNRPSIEELRQCGAYLREELTGLSRGAVVVALGKLAHDAVLRAEGLTLNAFPFGHGREHDLGGGRTLLDSYHCSRYNTQTRRLTPDMFAAIFLKARKLLDRGAAGD